MSHPRPWRSDDVHRHPLHPLCARPRLQPRRAPALTIIFQGHLLGGGLCHI
nr:MAG TPA: hypothetical protein [Caudoviricetes sp.]